MGLGLSAFSEGSGEGQDWDKKRSQMGQRGIRTGHGVVWGVGSNLRVEMTGLEGPEWGQN